MKSECTDLFGNAGVSPAVFGVPPNTHGSWRRGSARRDAEWCDRDGRAPQPARAVIIRANLDASALVCSLVARGELRYFADMKILTIEEAVAGLGRWVERALAGEQIQIRKGDAVVELRPARPGQPAGSEPLSPREALRRMQEEARLNPEQAEQYLREVHGERLAAEDPRPA